MPDNDFHYPPGAEPERPQEPETPQPETTPPADPAPEQEPVTPAEETPNPDTPPNADEPEQEPQPEPNFNKPRTLLEAKQAEKQRRKEAEATAETERSARIAAENRVKELEGLLGDRANAQTPADRAVVDDDLRQFAESQGLDPDSLKAITDFLANRIGGEKPSEAMQKKIDELEAWKSDQLTTATRIEEDRAIDAQAPAVKKQLKELGFEVHVDAESDKVMAEIKRLAHTKEFHDKPIDYIVWAKRAELSKMISPKRPSFETPTPSIAEPAPADVKFDGSMTPMQAMEATQSGTRAPLEVRQNR